MDITFGTPYQSQVDYLRAKLRVPTERWDDIQRSAHDRAFMVAGAAQADLLHDLHQAVIANAEQGRGLAAFQKDFRAIVAKHGWTGWTGEGSREGIEWRTRVIYQTNMATSYAAGRYRQLTEPSYVRLRPFWRYIHSDGVLHPRSQHLAWHGLTLRHDHPFWKTHFPPNGWGCQCRVAPVSAAEGERSARVGLGEPPEGWDKPDERSGRLPGIDKGYDYTPGARTDVPLRRMVQEKLLSYPPAIAQALAQDVGRYLRVERPAREFAARVLQDKQTKDLAWLGFVEDAARVSQVAGADVAGYLVTLPADVPRHVEASHGHDGQGQRPARPADYDLVTTILNAADNIRAGDRSRHGQATIVATKEIAGETFRAVFEVLPGKKNRALALLSLVIKTK